MSRAAAFKNKLSAYGEDVVVKMKPSAEPSNKCTCWSYDYPDPDCSLCGGSGYVVHPSNESVKAFVLPLAGDKELNMDIGVANEGRCNCFFSPDFNLARAEEVTWSGIRYQITDRDRTAIDNEIIYRNCKLERVD